ncbi:hypothetical protein [Spartinivicinus poritis]|uniref:Uncharacterized protein n=1 Tax=Spartinivicinus poritis TaxID=2994640 RepID=A0ABT5UDA9_9GAMM|nr:hypothetical protein [Spartinivicinus sp. A2-2]MDE1464365.1 hypothetical protein [Spartinivicinus sp. A2-2]
MIWFVLALLAVLIAMLVTLLKGAGKSQVAIEVSHIMTRIERARELSNEEKAKQEAEKLKQLLDREGLNGGIFDRARELINEVLS